MIRLLTAALVLLAPLTALADASLDAEEQEFLRLINEYRAAQGLDCLAPSPTLAAAAAAHSQQMGEEAFFSHNSPPCAGDECSGPDAFDRMAAAGHAGWSIAGENIFAGQATALEALAGWQASPPHDENMREPRFTAIGIGRADVPGSPYGIYWTTDFSNHDDGPGGCSYVPGAGGGAGDDGSADPGGDHDRASFLGCAAAAGPASLAPWLLLLFLRRSRRRPLEPTWKP